MSRILPDHLVEASLGDVLDELRRARIADSDRERSSDMPMRAVSTEWAETVELSAGLPCASEAGVPGSELLAVLAPEL